MGKLDSLWQEITKVLKWLIKNRALLKMVLRLGFIIVKLLEHIEHE